MKPRTRLQDFTFADTAFPDEMRAALSRSHDVRTLDVARTAADFRARASLVKLKSISLAYCYYGADALVVFPETKSVRQQICLAGHGRTTVNGEPIEIRSGQTSTLPSCTEIKTEFAAEYEQLVLAVDMEALNKKCAAIFGVRPKKALEFETDIDCRQPETQRLRRLILFITRELESASNRTLDPFFDEMEEAVVSEVLCGTRHSLSDLLAMRPDTIAPWQVRSAEDYIEAHWNQIITVELLAAVTGASARSIFSSFQKWRGYSPIAFLKSVRLRHAAEMLARGDAQTSVTGVALACGFHSLGHFAKDYRAIFGVLPSVTLAKARGTPVPASEPA